jgi:hypothetical protein
VCGQLKITEIDSVTLFDENLVLTCYMDSERVQDRNLANEFGGAL